jgi:hypothetical protein
MWSVLHVLGLIFKKSGSFEILIIIGFFWFCLQGTRVYTSIDMSMGSNFPGSKESPGSDNNIFFLHESADNMSDNNDTTKRHQIGCDLNSSVFKFDLFSVK